MVSVAQFGRATGCGPVGRGFKSRHSPCFFKWRYRLVVRTPRFQCGNRGSIPRSATILATHP